MRSDLGQIHFEGYLVEEKGGAKIGKKWLTHSHMGIYYFPMPRAATTSDAFNAIAEPRRRDILNYLAMQERSVTEIVDAMEMEQPSVSKHLKVLKGVGLVEVRREGRQEALQSECNGGPTVARMDEHVREAVETPAAASQGTSRGQQCAEKIVLWNFKLRRKS